MKFCKTHPDREAVKPYRMCAECLSETKKRLQKKYSACSKETWMEVNLKDLLNDTKSERLNVTQLSKRYRISYSTVVALCKKYGVTPKTSNTFCGKKINDMSRDAQYVPDMHLACATIYPKHCFHLL